MARGRTHGTRVAWFLLVGLLTSGCSSLPYSSDYPLSSYHLSSPGGTFRFRIPRGWFSAGNGRDTAADSHGTRNLIWLLKNDYSATIAVAEIHVDSTARRLLRDEGLAPFANLTAGLTSGGNSSVLVRPPEFFRLNGREFCSYETLISSTGDAMRIVLFTDGSKLFEATALVKQGGNGADRAEVFSAQQSFLDSLRW